MKYRFLLVLIIAFIFDSCQNDNESYEVGGDLIDNNINVFEVDTLTIETATIISDSIITSSASRILVGALQDEEFGNLTAQSFFSLMGSSFNIDNDAEFDSIALILHYDQYYYGDTTQVQTYSIHEVTEKFEPSDDDDYFYNTSSLDYDDTVLLGQLTFTPLPNKKDSIIVPLNYEFGESLFSKIADGQIEDSFDFQQELRGITIVADSTSNNVLGFEYSGSLTKVRFYYTLNDDDDPENDEYHLDFTLTGGYELFNKIVSDRSETLLSSLESSEDVLTTSDTQNKAYLQSGTGLSLRVDFPSLLTLNELEGDVTVLKAVLQFYPDSPKYGEEGLSDFLAVHIINSKNTGVKDLTTGNGTVVYAILNSQDNEFDAQYYTVDLSSYVEELLTAKNTLDYALRIEFIDKVNTINRLLINDPISPEDSNYKMKLLLTYLTY
ncbi:DUF4270 family protein [Flavicella sp.]|uniref:DUF4270 family protein n=1 Tax=Flavicella sp. TaxID=2957742 RepID=UPI00301767D4